MYHYTESGLTNVWLMNGFNKRTSPEGELVSISDVDELHTAIGLALTRRPSLSGAEFKFLRKEMGLSQKALGALMGASEESISLWERNNKVPKSFTQLMRFIYASKMDGNQTIGEIVNAFIELDSVRDKTLTFEDTQCGWKVA